MSLQDTKCSFTVATSPGISSVFLWLQYLVIEFRVLLVM